MKELNKLEKLHNGYVNLQKKFMNDIKSILYDKSVNSEDKIEYLKRELDGMNI
jgi:hypothetical protein